MAKTKTNIDELVKQALQEYKEAHRPKVEAKYGNTYVTVYEDSHYNQIIKLLDLAHIRYAVDLNHYYDEDGKIILNIDGDDSARAEFIRKFIHNGFRLTWE